jgi:hypothetical protein
MSSPTPLRARQVRELAAGRPCRYPPKPTLTTALRPSLSGADTKRGTRLGRAVMKINKPRSCQPALAGHLIQLAGRRGC